MWERVLGVGVRGVRLGTVVVVVVAWCVVACPRCWWCVGTCPRCRGPGGSARCRDGGGGDWGGVGKKKQGWFVRILVLFYTMNFTTYSSKVDYTMLTLICTKTRHNTLKTKVRR